MKAIKISLYKCSQCEQYNLAWRRPKCSNCGNVMTSISKEQTIILSEQKHKGLVMGFQSNNNVRSKN